MQADFFGELLTDAQGDPAVEALECLCEELEQSGYAARGPGAIVSGLLARTPGLTVGEQALLLESVAETAASTPARRTSSPAAGSARTTASTRGNARSGTTSRGASGAGRGAARTAGGRGGRSSSGGSVNWGGLLQGFTQGVGALTQGIGAVQQGAQVISQLTGRAPAAAPASAPSPAPEPAAAPPSLPALEPGATPALPGQAAPSAASVPAAPAPAAPGTPDATALLGVLLANPELQRAVAAATVLGPSGPRTARLEVPRASGGGGLMSVQIPVGAIMNAIVTLATQSMLELNALTREDDPELPEHLLSEDGELLVDPASPEERAALVVHYFRLAGEAIRRDVRVRDADLSASDRWARDAGFEDWMAP